MNKKHLLILLLSITLSACSSFQKMSKKDQSPGLKGSEPTIEPYWKVRITSRLKWRPFSFRRQTARPSIKDGILFVGNLEGLFSALDINKKKTLWEFKAIGPIESAPAVEDGIVFFGTSEGMFYALRAEDGREEWSVQLSSPIFAAPLIEEDKVIVKASDGSIYAFDRISGKRLWTYTVETEEKPQIRDYTSPVVYENKVLFYSRGYLIILDPESGLDISKIRITKKGDNFYLPHQPLVERNLIYTTDGDGNLIVLDKDGRKIWASKGIKIYQFLIAKDRIIITTEMGEVIALNKITGETLWHRRVSRGKPAGLCVSDGLVAVVSTYKTSLFDISFLSTTDGYMDIFDLKRGRRLWTYKVESGISAPPVATPDRIVFLTENGILHIFEIS